MWVKDPKTEKKSVSLTMLIISFILLLICVIIKFDLAYIKTLEEIFFYSGGLYFFRKFNFNKSEVNKND